MLNSRCRYALQALMFLAQEADLPHTTEQIAAATAIPLPTLAKILQSLAHAGLVKTQRGVGGGVELARDPAHLSVKQMVEAIDPGALIHYSTLHRASCPRLAVRLATIEQLTHHVLERTMLGELVDGTNGAETALDRQLQQVASLIDRSRELGAPASDATS